MRATFVIIGVTAALAMATGEIGARQQAVFRSEADAVRVNVSVRGGNKPVSGLTAADFQLLDNGVKQSIETFAVERLPVDVTLLLDVSRSVEGPRLERLKSGVLETARLLRPEDRIRLIAVQHSLHEVFPFEPGGTRPPVEALTAAGGTSLYDGIVAALVQAPPLDRRQLIIAYTDGQDTISVLPFETVREVAGLADAVLHLVIPTTRPSGSKPEVAPGAGPLSDLALGTGGQLFLMNSAAPVSDAFKQALDDFRTSYVLSYVPQGVTRTGWHDLDVKVTSGTYDVRTRKGYSGG